MHFMIVVLVCAIPGLVQADQANIEAGIAAVREARFEAALEAFARAEADNDLSLDDLKRVLLYRAWCHRAMGDSLAFEAALLALASLNPSEPLDNQQSPTVRQTFDRLRTGLSHGLEVVLTEEQSPHDLGLKTNVIGDVAGLVREVRILVQVGTGPWNAAPSEIRIPNPTTAVHYYAEAIGPGGAIVAHDGSASESHLWSAPTLGFAPPPTSDMPVLTAAPARDPARRRPRTGWIVTGVVGAVVAAVGVTLVLTVGSDASKSTTLHPPTYPF